MNAAARIPAEAVVADVGSTLTKLTAVADLDSERPRLLGQAVSPSTVADGDVTLGLDRAREELEARHGVDTREATWLASSSAAGGLRMTVHGLTRDMTLRAAREASLGAGAIVVASTAGRIDEHDLDGIRAAEPRVVLLAGGVDDGDRETVVANARALTKLALPAPVVFAGNAAARAGVEAAFEGTGIALRIVENVYPSIDELNVEPVRRAIEAIFAEHIVTAPGMEQLRERLTGDLVPTPAAVLQATEALAGVLGDVMTVDVGGATTDVHSVTEGAERYAAQRIAPEPRSKRSVEGDLGVYVNAQHVAQAAGEDLAVAHVEPLPRDEVAHSLAVHLARLATTLAVRRHAGSLKRAYGPEGVRDIAVGRDLTAVRWLVGTGGALTRLGAGLEILRGIPRAAPAESLLLPPPSAMPLVDANYIMAACGVLGREHPEAASRLLLASLDLLPEEAAT